MARKHGDHGHERAEQDHLEAAAAHEAAMAKPLDDASPVPPCGRVASQSGLAEGGRAAVKGLAEAEGRPGASSAVRRRPAARLPDIHDLYIIVRGPSDARVAPQSRVRPDVAQGPLDHAVAVRALDQRDKFRCGGHGYDANAAGSKARSTSARGAQAASGWPQLRPPAALHPRQRLLVGVLARLPFWP